MIPLLNLPPISYPKYHGIRVIRKFESSYNFIDGSKLGPADDLPPAPITRAATARLRRRWPTSWPDPGSVFRMGLTLMRVRENLEVCSFHARNGLAAIHGLEVKIR